MFKFVTITGLWIIPLLTTAQRGDELLVYTVKGKVTCVYKNKETPVKIGKVLFPGSVVKTQKESALTVVCTKGKPISVSKQGSFPVSRWRDSCKTTGNSVSTNYFKYIWQELYSYSPEHKEALRKKDKMAVARGEGPPGTKKQITGKPKMEFNRGMDTLLYDGQSFPLSWNMQGYRDYYYFKLYAENDDLIYSDSLRFSFIDINRFSQLLTSGNLYYWTVAAKGISESKKKVLKYVQQEEVNEIVSKLLKPITIAEDSAAVSFRVAFMLEQQHYLAEAYNWYQQAAIQDPEILLYRDKLIRFRNEFWIR